MKQTWLIIFFLITALIISGSGTGISETPSSPTSSNRDLSPEALSDRVRDDVDAAVRQRRQTQAERDRWQQEKERLQQAFENLTAEQNRLTEENQDLKNRIEAFRTDIAEFEARLQVLSEIPEELTPLLQTVFNNLEAIVADDLPFLAHQRSAALTSLAEVLNDPDVSAAEKLRRTIELYETEWTYGHTISAYQHSIQLDGEPLAVNVFRLGRLSLFFQTPDKERCGWYNPAESQWQLLSDEYNQAVTAAIDIAEKRRSVRILNLPLGRIAVP